jgi:hypothetical protein
VSLGADLFTALARKYSDATKDQVLVAVSTAVRGADLVGVSSTESIVWAAAENELRLALGLQGDVARLDPEKHARP